MRRYSKALVCAAALALVVSACSSSSSPSTTTPPTTPTVTSITVSGTVPAIGASTQFTATANLSNGTTQDVTSQATWRASAPDIGAVTAAGVVSAIMPGITHITATYQGVSGTADIAILAPATPLFFTVRGTITNAVTGAPIGNVNIFLGTPAGNKNATTDNNGNWSIAGIPNGSAGIVATLTGYLTNSKTFTVSADTRVDLTLTPSTPSGGGGTSSSPVAAPTVPSRTASGTAFVCKLDDIVHPAACVNDAFGNATALCQDGARSCSTSNSGTCSSHSGVYCFVCPGPLCPP